MAWKLLLALVVAGLFSNQLSRASAIAGGESWTRSVILQNIAYCFEYEDGSLAYSRFAPREGVDIKRAATAGECASLPRFRVQADTWMPFFIKVRYSLTYGDVVDLPYFGALYLSLFGVAGSVGDDFPVVDDHIRKGKPHPLTGLQQ